MPAHGYGNLYDCIDSHGCSLLPIGLLLVGCSGHQCGCSNKYNCASCWQALLATSRAAPCRALRSLVRLLQKLGCAHATTSVGAATKRWVAKDTALHVQYLLKSILCNSHEQIQQLMTLGSNNPFSFILESLPRVSSQLSNHRGGHQGHWTLVDQWDQRHEGHPGFLSRTSWIWSPAGRMPVSPKRFQDRAVLHLIKSWRTKNLNSELKGERSANAGGMRPWAKMWTWS